MTNANRLALVLLPLLLAGCSPPVLAPSPEVPLSRSASIKFGGDWTPTKRERLELVRLVDLAERAFLEVEGGTTPPVRTLTLWPRATVPRSLYAGELPSRFRYRGLCRRAWLGASIDLATSGRSPMSALPHELLHARIGDPDHESPAFRRLDRIGRSLSLLP